MRIAIKDQCALPVTRHADAGCDLARRGFLVGLTATAATLAATSPYEALARTVMPMTRDLAFRSLHTGEEIQATYIQGGRLVPSAVGQINQILRDWRSGEVFPMDPRLLDILHTLRYRLGSTEPFEVISAYRSPKTNAMLRSKSKGGVARRSLHMRGMAIDVRLPDRSLKALQQQAIRLQAGGVGMYSKSGFVHLDTGRPRKWGS